MSRRTVDKGLLKNIIRHTGAQNKIQEQNEMWKRWELKKLSRKESRSPDIDNQVRGYMRSDLEHSRSIKAETSKWNRLLMEYEESCKDRWGHSGYKELYPEEFSNHDSNQSDAESQSTNSKKKRKLNVEFSEKKKKRKRAKKEKTKKKRKLDSDYSDNNLDTEHKHKRKKKTSSRKHTESNERRRFKKRNKRTKQ